jgi:general nucleoside transport system ATP-binding protein
MAQGSPGTRLRLVRIAKSFGDKVAIKNVDLEVSGAEVHAVCGENGAGKSTLMNILAGILQPDAGTIEIDGRAVSIPDPNAAARLGVGMVHQHFTLVPSLTVAENIFLGRQPKRFAVFTDHHAMTARAQALLERYGFDLDPLSVVATLSVGQRQRVEILKALAFDARILILDEPTAVLTPREVDELLAVMSRLRQQGSSIIFITHKLHEAKTVSQTVTVIRDGASVLRCPTAEVSEADIARAMVGRDVFLTGRGDRAPSRMSSGTPVLALNRVTMLAPGGRRRLDNVSLVVHAGEILGIAGVDGNGQTELSEAIAGLLPIQGGRIELDGVDMRRESPGARRRLGMAFIPEDRIDRGLALPLSVSENVAASNYRRAGLLRRGVVAVTKRDAFAEARIARFDIRGARAATPVGALSGGNMQKVVLAREFESAPRLLVVAQPTRGLDVGASEFVYGQLLAAADRGCAVLLVSSELSEILALSDRIGVMFRGRIVGVVDRNRASEAMIGMMMSGVTAEAA